MVAKYSDDEESKKAGGALGKVIISTSPYADDLKKAIFALKVGEVSSPYRQNNGLLLVQLEEKTTQPLNEVIEPIVQELRQTHLNDYANEQPEPALSARGQEHGLLSETRNLSSSSGEIVGAPRISPARPDSSRQCKPVVGSASGGNPHSGAADSPGSGRAPPVWRFRTHSGA